MIIALVIFGVVIFAGILILATTRRRETYQATGQLSREAQSRDKKAARAAAATGEGTDAGGEPTGRDVEKAAALARRESGQLEKVESSPPAEWVPPDPEAIGVTRRQFLNRSIIGGMAVGIGGFGAASIAFLYPSGVSGFGSKINVGVVSDLLAEIKDSNGFLYKPEGRMWLTPYPPSALEKARQVYSQPELNSMEAGITVLFQKCPHLGCRVPDCQTSQWFECPCHGSRYNRAGEKKGGPAPRGMDRFATEVTDRNELIVNTGAVINGPPIGTDTTGQEAEGPSCLGASSHE